MAKKNKNISNSPNNAHKVTNNLIEPEVMDVSVVESEMIVKDETDGKNSQIENQDNENVDGNEQENLDVENEIVEHGAEPEADNESCLPTETNETVLEPVIIEDDDEKEDEDNTPLMEEDNLNLGVLGRILKNNWWVLLLNSLIVGAIAALLIIEEPRTYTSEIKLAPETEDISAGGSLSSIASTFGVDLNSLNSSDAIRPDLYPDLVQSVDFVYNLFKLPVKTIDGNIYTDYYTYLSKYQKSSWWGKAISDFKKKLQNKPENRKLTTKSDSDYGENHTKVRYLTADEEAMIENINGKINCSIDQKTFIISISVTDQDPLIAATVADSVSARIQNFITDYRTKKATKDYQYYLSLLRQAKTEYEKSCEQYAKYVDSHRDVILQAYISERDQLENDMQLKLNTYNAMITQAQQAKSKVQENTPAFTILQNAFVPVKPSGPKRMLFVFGMVFLTLFMTVLVIVVKELFRK